MDDKALEDALKPLNSGPKLLAYWFKSFGEDGVRELVGGKPFQRETLTKWSAELRAMRLIRLADLLDSIAIELPPAKAMPPPAHAIDPEAEANWQAWLVDHPQWQPWERERLAERAAWHQARGLA
jgi:hypothetical protein